MLPLRKAREKFCWICRNSYFFRHYVHSVLLYYRRTHRPLFVLRSGVFMSMLKPAIFRYFFIIAIVLASFSFSNAQTNSAALLSDSFAEVAGKVEAAVVSIDTKGKTPEPQVRGNVPPGDADDLMEFLRRQSRRPAYGVGSGFIVDKAGYILTNEHVVKDAVKITVRLESGEEFPATVVGIDEETDLAVLKIDANRELSVVTLGDSDKARVGEWVLAIGSPFGLARTVTAGIISQTNRDTPTTTVFQRFIQTDAAINRGNSGGPLVNMRGEVVGVNSQIATSTGDYNGVGFALPVNEARHVFEQIVKNGKVRRGFLGVTLETVKPEFARVFGLAETKGAIVTDIRFADSGASKAGLKAGDIVVRFRSQPVLSAQDLIAKVSATPPDQSVDIEYLRETGTTFQRHTTQIRLGERPIARQASLDQPEPVKLGKKEDPKPLGLTLDELTPTLAATYKLEGQKGVLVKEINPDSYIADVKASNGLGSAIGEGDLIQRVNGVNIADRRSFEQAANKLKKGDAVVLHVLTFNASASRPILKVVQFTVQ